MLGGRYTPPAARRCPAAGPADAGPGAGVREISSLSCAGIRQEVRDARFVLSPSFSLSMPSSSMMVSAAWVRWVTGPIGVADDQQ
jgi:hypothetical protein